MLGPLSNGLPFLGAPKGVVPWISLLLPSIGWALVLVGVWRAFWRSQFYRGKIVGTGITVVSTLLLAASVAFFLGARHIPTQLASAPHVGQQLPDFTLPDSAGRPVSLAQLFQGTAGITPPKAVLLVSYRGYW